MGDENLDLFVFFGEPKDILDEYTDLVGKPGMPPFVVFWYMDEPYHLFQ